MSFFASSARLCSRPAFLACSLCALLACCGPLAAASAAARPAPTDTTGAAAAPSSGSAFETVALSAGGSANVNTGLFDTFYHASPGARVASSTPFYAGTVALNAGLRHYETRLDSSENFWAVPLTLGWGLRPHLTPRLSVETEGRVGVFVMDFSGGPAGLGLENELVLGLDAGLSFRFAEGWRLVAGGGYERLYTNPGIDFWHVSLGLRRTFQTPGWLKHFLQ